MPNTEASMYKCALCACIWHDPIDYSSLYQSDSYRVSMGEDTTLQHFYTKHDAEILEKLAYTGTALYRDKLCMDIGCGGGGLADFINGVARKTILVEPNESFASLLREKGYEVFSYAEDALEKYINKIEVLTTYDVIEHVSAPKSFMQTIFRLLVPGGIAYIGTPTEYPVLHKLLGAEFDSFVFSA